MQYAHQYLLPRTSVVFLESPWDKKYICLSNVLTFGYFDYPKGVFGWKKHICLSNVLTFGYFDYPKGVFGWKKMKGKEGEGFEGKKNPLSG